MPAKLGKNKTETIPARKANDLHLPERDRRGSKITIKTI